MSLVPDPEVRKKPLIPASQIRTTFGLQPLRLDAKHR